MSTRQSHLVEASASDFYVEAMSLLDRATIPYLVGGAFAFARYTNTERETKDLDLFVLPADISRVLREFERDGYRTDLPFPHWLGKVQLGERFIDIIFSSGNGVARVDDEWFAHAVVAPVLGRSMPLCPPEEIIWSKAFVQERERFDGADVIHLLRALGPTLDWPRLLTRFGDHWRVLLSSIVMFGFVYPDQRDLVPDWVLAELIDRLTADRRQPDNNVCNGTLLSREQYLGDLEQYGYRDARIQPSGRMTPRHVEIWTKAIEPQK